MSSNGMPISHAIGANKYPKIINIKHLAQIKKHFFLVRFTRLRTVTLRTLVKIVYFSVAHIVVMTITLLFINVKETKGMCSMFAFDFIDFHSFNGHRWI